jgi:competence protein ComEC
MATEPFATEPFQGDTFLRPLLPIASALAVGILAGGTWPGFYTAALVIAGLLALALAWYIRHRCRVLVLPIVFCAICGYLSIQPWLIQRLPAGHVVHYVNQGQWQVQGVVRERLRGDDHQQAFLLEAAQLVQGGRAVVVRGKVRVTARGETDPLGPGDGVTLHGHLRAVKSFCNFGGFDYQRFMALQGVHVRLFAQAEDIRRADGSAAGWRGGLEALREGLGQRMAAALTNHPTATVNLLTALTLGMRDGIPADLNQAFSRAGVSHVIAISGLNIGMVALAAFALLARLLVWSRPLTDRGWVRKAAALGTLPAVVGYCLLAGMTPSVQRAMIMCLAFLLTFWIGRRHDLLNSLALAALLILVVAPPEVWSISFQLSFISVLAIILGLRRFPTKTPDSAQPALRRGWLRFIAMALVSIWAILGTTPLVMFYFNQVCWVGPLTNLAVVPLAGLVIPLGLAGIVLAPLSTHLAWLCWQAAAYGLDGLVLLVEAVAQWPWAASTTVTPSLLELGLGLILPGLFFLARKRGPLAIGLAVCLLIGGVDAAYWWHRRFDRERMTVTVLDVGQGSANLLQLPGGFTVLTDGGGFGDNATFDVGRSVVAPVLWRNKIRTIDRMILTHPNSDHLNGLIFILNNFAVGEVWSNHEATQTAGYRLWLDTIAARGIRHVAFDQLPRRSETAGVQFEILGPPLDFMARRGDEKWRDENANSLVTRVILGQLSFLFSGDITARMEQELVAQLGNQGLGSTVLVVPHHGSRGSSSPAFLSAVQPREAVISAGADNRFHFPHPEVTARLAAEGARVWRTDQCGAVRLVTDGTTCQTTTCQDDCP